MKLLITLLLICSSLTSCLSTGSSSMSGVKPPKLEPKKTWYLSGSQPTWNDIQDAKKFLTGATWNNNTVDLKGNAVSGKKLKHPSNSQNENSIPLKIDINKFTITNGIFTDIPGGIVIKGRDNKLDGLTFTVSGEDFLSTQRSTSSKKDPIGLTVKDCKFYNDGGGDKSLQFNNADDVVVDGAYITGGITGIRLQESRDKKKVSCVIKNTTFEKVDTAMNIAGNTTVTLSGNKYKSVNKQTVKSGSGVKLINK